MAIEYDKYGNKYETEEIKQHYKICPLTGKYAMGWKCDGANCSEVTPDKEYSLYGHVYHCEEEKRIIQANFEAEIQKEAMRLTKERKQLESIEASRQIDLQEFLSFCKLIDEYMLTNQQKYTKEMIIQPFLEEDERMLVFWFVNNEVAEICMTENLTGNISTRLSFLKNDSVSVSYRTVPEYLAEAIKVNLCIKYRMDIKQQIHDDNPIYIKEKGISKYMETVYGWSWHKFDKMRKEHPELTEIVNYSNIVYFKQEIDDIIRREYKNHEDI